MITHSHSCDACGRPLRDWKQGHLLCPRCRPRGLNPFEHWMVRSNLNRIQSGAATAADTIATLRANGYPHIAHAVQTHADTTRIPRG